MGENENKRDLAPSNSIRRLKKRARFDKSPQIEAPIATSEIRFCGGYGSHYPSECLRRLGTCLRCKSMEHSIRDFPLYSNQPPSGRGPTKSGNGKGRGQRLPSRSVNQTEAKQPFLVYAARHREDRGAANVINGAFYINFVPYFSLIDIDSNHSYTASTNSVNLAIPIESTSGEVSVISPLVQTAHVNKIYRRCPLEIQGVVFPTNLMELPFGEFYLILRMNWLIQH
ncbi:uncharacterized protein LOC108487745 [Gossypium arboreum]|uniref:uncharacterized protein LOC108487745 n=1 Tax=Gossypium arboreum TaxID=29729 RepID=UPI0008192458|nr:uncharacterized protein LOC108487745 [Gossypium arboreum]